MKRAGANAKAIAFELNIQRVAEATSQGHADYPDANRGAQDLLEAQKKQFRQAGMTDTQKAIDDFKVRGADPRTQNCGEQRRTVGPRQSGTRDGQKP